jgi:hypothetical protein
MKNLRIHFIFVAAVLFLGARPAAHAASDLVNANLIQFNQNGVWTWYSDQRTVVDTNGGKVVVGYVENGNGLGGFPVDGNVGTTLFDITNRTGTPFTLKPALLSFGGGDDHNAPALMVRPDGKYLAAYTGHNSSSNTFYRVYDPGSGTWSPEVTNDWSTQPGGDSFPTTYSNPWYLSAKSTTYLFARSNNKSPNSIISSDFGSTWSYGGELTTNDNVGYVNGYFKYWGNGVDRIDFICTEYHPRDFDTSIYHGFVSNNMSFNSFGVEMDTNILDKLTMPKPQDFTPVFLAGTVMPPGQTNYRCWNDGVCRYPDGTIECIITARINDNTAGNDANISPDHAFFFCRFNGTSWTPTYLCQAGYKLYSSEADYVGLGCLSPNDPNTIYISTEFDPRAVKPGVTDTNLPYSTWHEIWKGVTTNQGASFTWTPLTQNSLRDNLRPVVPAWDANDTVLLWFRGVYTSAQIIDGAPVGIMDRHSETVGQLHYVDATTSNTFFTNGTPLSTGPGMNQWHLQAAGNAGTVFSSADSVAETPTNLMTQVPVPAVGNYDVWVNFWGSSDTNADWRIVAGLVQTNMQIYRSQKCEQVQPATEDTSLVLTNNGTNFLYQAYLGRATVTTNLALTVFVGANPVLSGTSWPTQSLNTVRTWYDGISYASVERLRIQNVAYHNRNALSLTWNSPSPQFSLTTPSYTVQKKNSLSDANWITLTNGIPSGGYSTTFTDSTANGNTAFYRVSWP